MNKGSCCDYQNEPCHDYQNECLHLKEELDRIRRRLDEADKIVNELRKENEKLKVACDEQFTDLIRYEAQIEAFKFVISNGR